MADKSQSLILDALTRAAAEPGGLPLLGSKTAAGLFTTNVAGKQAAQHSKDQGLLRVLRLETKGRNSQEICVLTEKGLALLLDEANPRLVLEAFVGALDARHHQGNVLLESVRASQEELRSLRVAAEKVLQQLSGPAPAALPAAEKNGKHDSDPVPAVLAHLRRRHEANTLDDCPLPELYRHTRASHPGLTIGQFHDLLRRLHEDGKVYLHPWTGPLYELPEPACALLVGHEIAYYASLRLPPAA